MGGGGGKTRRGGGGGHTLTGGGGGTTTLGGGTTTGGRCGATTTGGGGDGATTTGPPTLTETFTRASACEYVREFGAELQKKFPDIPLVYVDEYYTTIEAAKKLHAAGKRAKDFKPIIDQAAAVEILNLWLERTGPPVDMEYPDFY